MLDDATRSRLAHCLDHYDTGSPTEADVGALWRAYTAQATRLAAVEPVYAAAMAWGAPDADIRGTYERLRDAVAAAGVAGEGAEWHSSEGGRCPRCQVILKPGEPCACR